MSAVKVIIPQLDIEQNDQPLEQVVVKGVKNITYNPLNADTENDNNFMWSFQPPSQNTILDRRLLLRVQVDIQNTIGGGTMASEVMRDRSSYRVVANDNMAQYTGVGGAGVATFYEPEKVNDITGAGRFVAIRDSILAPRQMPLHSCIDVIDIEINGTHISVSPKDYIHTLMRYTTTEFRQQYLSQTASYPDVFEDYIGTYGENDHPLGEQNKVGRKGEAPRGNFKFISQPNASTLRYEFTEPLFISPLLVGGLHEGLTNINQMNVSVRWDSGNLKRMFSFIQDGVLGASFAEPASTRALTNANLSVSFVPQSARLLVNYLTPQDDIKIPSQVVYPYSQPQLYKKVYTAIGIGANTNSSTLVGDNIRINQVPEKMYIILQKPVNEKTISDADFHLAVQNVNISWNNQTGILSGATTNQLHQLNKENGLDCDYNEYASDTGANGGVNRRFGVPLCLEFGKDIPLETGETIGMVGNYNLRVDVVAHNCSENVFTNLEYSVLLVMKGEVIIAPNEMRLSLGNVSVGDSMNAEKEGLSYADVSKSGALGGLEGGGFLSGLKHLVKRGAGLGNKLAEACDKYAPMVKKASATASKFTGGEEGGRMGRRENVGGSRVY